MSLCLSEGKRQAFHFGYDIHLLRKSIFFLSFFFFLANGVLQKEINDLCLLEEQQQQPCSFESSIKCVLFLGLSLFIWVRTEVHIKRLN